MNVKTYIKGITFQNKSKQNRYILTTHNILRFWELNLNIRICHSNEGTLQLQLFKCLFSVQQCLIKTNYKANILKENHIFIEISYLFLLMIFNSIQGVT